MRILHKKQYIPTLSVKLDLVGITIVHKYTDHIQREA